MLYGVTGWWWFCLTVIATVYGVAPKRNIPQQSDKAARAIRGRRNYLGKTQAQIVEETSGVIYPRLLSELETNARSVNRLTLPKLRALITALEWTAEEFSHETGIDVPASRPIPDSVEYSPTLAIPSYRSISSGINGVESERSPKPFLLDPNFPGLRGRDVTRLAVLKVNGDSMVSDSASEEMRLGSMLIVEWDAVPSENDMIVGWIEQVGASVLKRQAEGRATVLHSLTPTGPVFRVGDHEIDVRGVVRWVMQKPYGEAG